MIQTWVVLCLAGLSAASTGDWNESGHASGSVTLHFALKLENTDVLDAKFAAVSDPRNADYGQYWSREQLFNIVQPSEETVEVVSEWLRVNGVEFSQTQDRGFLEAILSIAAAERLLNVELYQYTAPNTAPIIRMRPASDMSLPSHLEAHVDAVFGITGFPILSASALPVGAEDVTPATLRALYDVNDIGGGYGSMGVAEFQGQSYSPKDLALFQKEYKLLPQTVLNTTGANDDIAHVEANLDIQYIMAMAQNISADFWLESGGFNLIKWITDVQAKSNTLVWSISYGEALKLIKAGDAQRLDTEFKKVGSLGISVIFASGDSGPYSRGEPQTKFYPTYPASLPSVTAVGATQLTQGKELESASFSGGGFGYSDYFARETTAPWQVDAVNTYFANKHNIPMPAAALYDGKGVGFPDVSAQGVNFKVYYHKLPIAVSGTSCAAPTFAGVVAMLNDARIKAGKPPMGFLNPFIYQNADAFHDITQGNNKDNTQAGWTTAVGWDPVTGMGTPDYPKLKAAAMAM